MAAGTNLSGGGGPKGAYSPGGRAATPSVKRYHRRANFHLLRQGLTLGPDNLDDNMLRMGLHLALIDLYGARPRSNPAPDSAGRLRRYSSDAIGFGGGRLRRKTPEGVWRESSPCLGAQQFMLRFPGTMGRRKHLFQEVLLSVLTWSPTWTRGYGMPLDREITSQEEERRWEPPASWRQHQAVSILEALPGRGPCSAAAKTFPSPLPLGRSGTPPWCGDLLPTARRG